MGYVRKPLYEKRMLFTGRVGTLGLIFRTSGSSWLSDNTLIVDPLDGFFDFTYFTLKEFDLLTLEPRFNPAAIDPNGSETPAIRLTE